MLYAEGQNVDEMILDGEVKFESFWIDRSTPDIGVDLGFCYGSKSTKSKGRTRSRWDGRCGIARRSCRRRAHS